MTPGERYCLGKATRCYELAERFKFLGRIDEMTFWIRVYHQFLRDAQTFKERSNAEQIGHRHRRSHSDDRLPDGSLFHSTDDRITG